MASTGNRGGGRRSKGERRFIGSRLPIKYADLLPAYAKAQNLTVSEYIETLVIQDMDRNMPEDRQEVLPIRMAS